jgi:mannose-6-phosphate isomerase-like protein (cupin superfamily)
VNEVRHTPAGGAAPPSRDELDERFCRAGLTPRWWSDGPGDAYAEHAHSYYKILYCHAGSITFHVPGGDVEVHPGDRLDIPRGVRHAATVGERGVTCVEAGIDDSDERPHPM